MRNVLVPLDGSAVAEQALAPALAVCRRSGADLLLLHVRGNIEDESYTFVEDPGRSYLGDLADRLSADLGRTVHATVLPKQVPIAIKPIPSPDTLAAMIATHAQRSGVDLIVLTTHGRSGLSRLWFGSVTEALLRRSQVPLLLVRPGDADEQQDRWSSEEPLRRVLVATDGSEVSRRAVELAAEFQKLFPAEYTLLRVLALPYEVLGALSVVTVAYRGPDAQESLARAHEALEREAGILRRVEGAVVKTEAVINPSPARGILDYARDNGMDLIVLASRSRGGVERFLVGSVADKVIRGGGAPVLLQEAPREGLSEDNAKLADEAVAASSA